MICRITLPAVFPISQYQEEREDTNGNTKPRQKRNSSNGSRRRTGHHVRFPQPSRRPNTRSIVIEGVKQERRSGFALLELRRRFIGLKGRLLSLATGKVNGRILQGIPQVVRPPSTRLIEATGEESPTKKHDGSAHRKPPHTACRRRTDMTTSKRVRRSRRKSAAAFRRGHRCQLRSEIKSLQRSRRHSRRRASTTQQNACYWISQLYFAGANIWKKLFTMMHEYTWLSPTRRSGTDSKNWKQDAERIKEQKGIPTCWSSSTPSVPVAVAKEIRAADNIAIHLARQQTGCPVSQAT